jgi:rSAM-associated Gly-rich repeat protein
MKKTSLFTAVAALALVSPLAMSAASAQQGLLRNDQMVQHAQYQGPSQQAQDRDDRDETRRGNRDEARGDDHRDRRESWRDGNREARWDDSRHNGYYQNGRWTYGPPSADRYGRANFELGYRPWAIGQSLGYYNNRFELVDYRRAQLRRPARGARWVIDDRGDYLMVNRSGRIMQVVVSGNEPRDRRQSWRDSRNDARWDDARHNGYYRNGQWTYGPPQGRFGPGEVVYGYQPWERGQRLGYYQGRYSEVDYRTDRRLRAPPRGQHWVRNDNGDLLLAAIAGGLITAVILNNAR